VAAVGLMAAVTWELGRSAVVDKLAAVLALVQRFTDRKTGHYGIGDGADGRIPKPGA